MQLNGTNARAQSILLVDDQPVVALGCQEVFRADNEFSIVHASSIAEARVAIKNIRPKIIILDVHLSDGSGFDLMREIRRKNSFTRVIVFSASECPLVAAHALECGATGYVSKNCSAEDLLEAVRAVARNEVWLSEKMMLSVALLKIGINKNEGALSARHTDILRYLVQDKDLTEIATIISLSYRALVLECIRLGNRFGVRSLMELRRISTELRIV